MIISVSNHADRIRLIAIEVMKGAFGNEAPFAFFWRVSRELSLRCTCRKMRSMPTVLRIGPYRFHFYSCEANEPPHIHVAREDFEVKFWLHPVSLAANYGFSTAEINRIRKLVEGNCDFLIEAYRRFHGNC